MMMHVPGVKHEIPDNLSRYSVSCDGPNDKIIGADEEALAFEFTTAHNLPAVTWDRVKVATLSDKSCIHASKQDLPKETHEYNQYRNDMYTIDGTVLYKDRIIVPVSLIEGILNIRHSAHQGVGPMLSPFTNNVGSFLA